MDRTVKTRWIVWATPILLAIVTCGCAVVPRTQLDQSRNLNLDLQERLRESQTDLAKVHADAKRDTDLATQARQQVAGEKEVRDILEQRVANLKKENERLGTELAGWAMNSTGKKSGSALANVGATAAVEFVLPEDVGKRLSTIAANHPREMTFDLSEKVCRFQSDRVFLDSGDRIRPEAAKILKELADSLRRPDAEKLNLLVVGHTASRKAVLGELAAQHPTDWHLAAHQAIAVEQFLEERGLAPARVGIASYASQQPLAEATDDRTASRNARLEIFLLPPDPPAE